MHHFSLQSLAITLLWLASALPVKAGTPVLLTAKGPTKLSHFAPASNSTGKVTGGQIRITEYMYDGAPGEYIEITNVGDAAIDLTGWSFDDSSRQPGSFSLSSLGIIQPNESAIITEVTPAVFRTTWYLPSTVKVAGGNSQNLGRSDEINIYDASNTLVDRLTYNDQSMPSTIRTQNTSGWAERENLGANTISTWKLSTANDAQNSYLSTTGNLGNPGGYFIPLPRVKVVESGGTTVVAEGGATDTYTIVLNNQPTAAVTIAISPNSQLSTNPTSLTFTTANWNTAQTVIVTAVDDAVVEGVHSGTVTHNPSSSDLAYNGIATNSVSATITDNDISATAPPTIQESTASTLLNLPTAGPGYVSGVINDPTDPASTLGIDFTIGDTDTPVGSLTVTASSNTTSVVANANLSLTGSGASRNLKITPTAVGFATISVLVSDGSNTATYSINYAASASSVNPGSTRFHTGTSDASTAMVLDANTMLVADDENQVLRLYDRTKSGLPSTGFDFTAQLGLTDISGNTPREVDLEASTRVGNRIYWVGSESNADGGGFRPNRNRVFATDLSGSGSASILTYAGRYDFLKDDILNWDATNGHGKGANYYGLVASANSAVDSKQSAGYNIEGVEMAPDNSTAYLAFRAPQILPASRTKALIVPVTNFTNLIAVSGGGTAGSASFGAPIEMDLGGRGIREIRKNANNQYIIIAGAAGNEGPAPNDFRLYTWTGNPSDAPVLRNTDLSAFNANGSFESILDVPNPLTDASQIQLLVDNGDAVYYNDGTIAKDLSQNNFKKFRSELVPLGASSTQPLAITVVSYDCFTGAIAFGKLSGDPNKTVEYRAIGVTDWTTNLTAKLDAEARTASDLNSINITARYVGEPASEVTYLWSRPAPCTQPISTTALSITVVSYDCFSGAITFGKLSSDPSKTVEYMAIGITGWTTNPQAKLDAETRTASDLSSINILARYVNDPQSQVSNLWTRPAPCDQPVSTPALSITVASYDCATGAITFGKLTGDPNKTVEYRAIGITDWTTNPTAKLDAEARTANDLNGINITARYVGESASEVSYFWTRPAPCNGARLGVTAFESIQELKIVLLGNPTSTERILVEVHGAEAQPLHLVILDLQGKQISEQTVERAGTIEQQTLGLGQTSGLYLLQVTTPTRSQTAKIIRQ
jgi:hypothetical protein